MNHGYCKNCWWWKRHLSITIPWAKGICYMQSKNIDIPGAEYFHETKEIDYCPDYINRKKEEKKSGTLNDWIEASTIANKL